MSELRDYLVSAETLNDARKILQSKVPIGSVIILEEILSAGGLQRIQGSGASAALACADAMARVPDGADVIERREIAQMRTMVLDVTAESEAAARAEAKGKLPPTAKIERITVTRSQRKGVWGIGRRRGEFRVVAIEPAAVEIAFRTQAALRIRVGKLPEIHAVFSHGGKMDGDLARIVRMGDDLFLSVNVGTVSRRGRSSPAEVLAAHANAFLKACLIVSDKVADSEETGLTTLHVREQRKLCSCGKVGLRNFVLGRVTYGGRVEVRYRCNACNLEDPLEL